MPGERRHLLQTTIAYEQSARAYEPGKDDRSWLGPLIARLRHFLAPPALVLDLGCGPGRETVELQAAGWRVVGLDIAPAFLRIARTRYPADGYVRGDFLHLPFAGRTVDGVWAAASLLHLTREEAPAALAELRRVLRPDGVLYCSMQIGSTAGMVAGEAHESVRGARYYTFYEPAEWHTRLEDAGFEVLALEAIELPADVAAISCNGDARGWMNVYARGRTA